MPWKSAARNARRRKPILDRRKPLLESSRGHRSGVTAVTIVVGESSSVARRLAASLVATWKRAACISWLHARRQPSLDCIHQHARNFGLELLVQFTHARWACDVDLSHVTADHIESDEQHAALPQASDRSAPTSQRSRSVSSRPSPLRACSKVAAIVRRPSGSARARRAQARHRSPVSRESPSTRCRE